MPVPKRINFNKRIKHVRVYYSIPELAKLIELAKEEHMKLSPFIRSKSLQKGIINILSTEKVERITKKDIERKMIVDPYGRLKKEILAELEQGVNLVPSKSLDVGMKSKEELDLLMEQYNEKWKLQAKEVVKV